MGSFVGFIIIFTCVPTQPNLENREHRNIALVETAIQDILRNTRVRASEKKKKEIGGQRVESPANSNPYHTYHLLCVWSGLCSTTKREAKQQKHADDLYR